MSDLVINLEIVAFLVYGLSIFNFLNHAKWIKENKNGKIF